ncbi:MAG: amino acid ABC transporter substrate-binding protein [Proteobacteria bacterium]|nr:amino acid ABC transporter substrate-binding protein [Pseudomonadota bacterium]
MRKLLFLMIFVLTLPAAAFAADAPKESVFERVMRTNTLRCGYFDWQPNYWVDSKTGKPQGVFFDVMQEISRIANLKIEWTQEVQFAHLITDLQEGRVDAVCTGIWANATRARQILFSQPVFYVRINTYVKPDDKRFEADLSVLNTPDKKIGVMDGEMAMDIKNTDFPRAQAVSVPQLAGTGSELLMLVSTGKADATFTDAASGYAFMKANPGTIRAVASEIPVRTIPNVIAVNGSELRLKQFLDDTLQQLQNSGVIEKILKRYDGQFPDALLRPARTYEVKK